MSMWLMAAAALLLGLVPCGIACLRGDIGARLVALELVGVVSVLVVLLVAVESPVTTNVDVAIVLAFVAFVGGLVFARFLERWL